MLTECYRRWETPGPGLPEDLRRNILFLMSEVTTGRLIR